MQIFPAKWCFKSYDAEVEESTMLQPRPLVLAFFTQVEQIGRFNGICTSIPWMKYAMMFV